MNQPVTARVSESERRRVTILFADLSGFTALSERLDPEMVRALQEDLFKAWASAVQEYDGYLEKFVGDAVMAVFGAPVAHERDPELAVRAALAIRESMAEINRGWQVRLGQPLAVHCGLNTGTVVAGDVGGDLGGAYAVTGDTVNSAARLQAAAGPGEILASDQTYRLTRNLFEYEARQPVRAKGKSEPLRAFALLGLRDAAVTTVPEGRRGIRPPMIGRDEDAARLVACVDAVAAGRGQVVGIIGEPGLGKSRLIAEVRAQFEGRPVLWLEGSALSYGRTISFWPFREIILSLCAISPTDHATEAVAKLRQRLEPVFAGQIAESLPYLATVLALEIPEELAERVKYLDGEAMRRQIFLTVKRMFELLARQCPTVLVFEDLHWLDPSSAELLDHLLPLIREVPLGIIGSARPEPDTPAADLRAEVARDYTDHYTEVRLKPLAAADSETLLRNLLRIDGVQSHVRDRILARTEGNPFFLEEVARSVADLRPATSTPGGGRAPARAGDLDNLTIPDTVQGVIMARIDRLGAELKEVLRVASVVGRTFAYRILAALSPTRQQLPGDVVRLQELELIRELRQQPDLEYMFEHALVQDATYESILVQRRRELHRQVINCIETLFADRLEEFYGVLAHHAARAEDWEKAQHYLLLAGDQAGRMAADAEALAHYGQAVEAYARVFGEKWDPVERAELERKIGEAHFTRGEHEQARARFIRSLSYLGVRVPSSRWGIRVEILQQIAIQAWHRIRPDVHPPDRSTNADPRVVRCVAQAVIKLGWIDILVRPEAVVFEALLLLNRSERIGDADGIVEGLATVGFMCDVMGAFRMAEGYHQRAANVSQVVTNPVILGQVHFGQGMHEHICRGHMETGLEHYQRAAAQYRRAGDLRAWGASMFQTIWATVQLGHFVRALEDSREMVRVGIDGSDHGVRIWGLQMLGKTLACIGSLDEAIGSLEEALKLARSAPDYNAVAVGAGLLGQCYLRRARYQEAVDLLEESSGIMRDHGLRGWSGSPTRTGLAEAYLVVAERASGDERRGLLKKARKAWDVAYKQARTFPTTFPQVSRQFGTYRWLMNDPKGAEEWWRRSLTSADQLGAPYESGLTHLTIGVRLGRREELEQAEQVFRELGAEWDLAQARAALDLPRADASDVAMHGKNRE